MKMILSLSNFLTNITKWAGSITIGIMMLFIFTGVVMRQLGSPVLGSVEIVQFMMVITIMSGLSYCESQNGHISVELIFDKFPKKVQNLMLIIINLLSLVCVSIIAFVYYKVVIKNFVNGSNTSDLLGISFLPFETIIAICFTVWFLQLLGKTLMNRKEV